MNKSHEIIISNIKIKGLFGNRDVDIQFSSRACILIGENGLGKTTILSIINTLLSGDIQDLNLDIFDSITIELKGHQIFELTSEILKQFQKGFKYISEDIDIHAYKLFEWKFLEKKDILIGNLNPSTISSFIRNDQKLCSIFDSFLVNYAPLIFELITENPVVFNLKYSLRQLNLKIIYLPTYRRIEADLSKLISDIDRHKKYINPPQKRDYYFFQEDSKIEDLKNNPYIHFGMKDINSAINNLTSRIIESSVKGYSQVSGKMITELIKSSSYFYEKLEFDTNQIDIVLKRIGKSIGDESRNVIIEDVKSGKIRQKPLLVSFLQSLLDLYKKQKIYDSSLKSFVKACNAFLYDKIFIYDESLVNIGLYYKNDKKLVSKISLDKLSSGEKQLIALLAMSHLEINRRVIILIDEPELSLSIVWQKKLLPTLLEAPLCTQILAVTHSPFIFTNDLRESAFGTDEYMSLKR